MAPKNFSIRKIVKGYIGNLSKALKWIKELVSFKIKAGLRNLKLSKFRSKIPKLKYL